MSDRLNGVFNGLPGWAKLFLLLSSVAFSTVVSLYFMGQHAGYIPSELATKEQLVEHKADTRTMLRVLQQVCVNTAKDWNERAGCWP